MCILNHSTLQKLNGSPTAIASPRTSKREEASTSPKRMMTKPVALCVHVGLSRGLRRPWETQFFNSAVGKQQTASRHVVVCCQFSQGFSNWARFRTSCCHPTTVLNGFKPVIVAVMTKLIVTTVNPLTNDDAFWRRQNLAACYQLAQSVLKIGSALAERVG